MSVGLGDAWPEDPLSLGATGAARGTEGRYSLCSLSGASTPCIHSSIGNLPNVDPQVFLNDLLARLPYFLALIHHDAAAVTRGTAPSPNKRKTL